MAERVRIQNLPPEWRHIPAVFSLSVYFDETPRLEREKYEQVLTLLSAFLVFFYWETECFFFRFLGLISGFNAQECIKLPDWKEKSTNEI